MIKTTLIAGLIGLSSMTSDNAAEQPPLRQPQENSALPSKVADAVLTYGAHRNQFVHLRLPDKERFGQGPYPTILVIHGGCWVRPYASADNIAAFADALRDEGYATLNVEYRTVDEAGGGWPGTIMDIAAVADHVRTWAKDWPIDANRVASTGHSAGGHLALWALARARLDKDSPLYAPEPQALRGSVILGGPGDLFAAKDVWAESCGVDSITPFLGGPQLMQLNAASASPAEMLPFAGKHIFITGSRDHVVPPHITDIYMEKAHAAGADAHHHVIEGTGHHEYLAPKIASNWSVIIAAFKEIFAGQ